jgi:hypothetical protein
MNPDSPNRTGSRPSKGTLCLLLASLLLVAAGCCAMIERAVGDSLRRGFEEAWGLYIWDQRYVMSGPDHLQGGEASSTQRAAGGAGRKWPDIPEAVWREGSRPISELESELESLAPGRRRRLCLIMSHAPIDAATKDQLHDMMRRGLFIGVFLDPLTVQPEPQP